MYLADALREARLRRPAWRQVATGNVVALGLVSMATDVSSEMVTAVLPAYLVLGLHLSFAQYGVLDGIYTGATAVTRLLGGWCADRFQARKLVAGLGYGLSAVAKIGLLVVSVPAAIGAVLAVDRTGKGLRTAPRDAMIALSVDQRDLGQAFGLHRTMDSAGAFLGPLAALGLLGLAGSASYDSVFFGSLCAALIGLIVLALFVDNRAGHARRSARRAGPAYRLCCAPPPFRRICLVAALLGLVTIGDGFVFLVLQDRDDLPVRRLSAAGRRHQPRLLVAGDSAGPAGRPVRALAGGGRRLRLPARGVSCCWRSAVHRSH